ncbi:MAG TPA: small ribosomal subunit Rsm22 family protein, partial [Spirochaetia bacterium]|nr:small ribosomal subunit Rsm22 family protein [Spirochaetia bacterium]
TAADINRSATSLGRRLLPDTVNVTFATWNATTSSPPPAGRYDTILFSHVLNELWPERADRVELRAALLQRLVPSLRPSGRIIVLEPALLGITRDLLALRNEISAAGWKIKSPCFLQAACPALAIPDGTCHAAFRWQPPEPTGAIARLAGIDKTRPAMSYLVASPPDRGENIGTRETGPTFVHVSGASEPYRVVSDPMRNKAGRDRLFVCGNEGRFAISAGPNDAGSAVQAFRSAGRGDIVKFAGLTRRGEGFALTEAATFAVLRKGGKAAEDSRAAGREH